MADGGVCIRSTAALRREFYRGDRVQAVLEYGGRRWSGRLWAIEPTRATVLLEGEVPSEAQAVVLSISRADLQAEQIASTVRSVSPAPGGASLVELRFDDTREDGALAPDQNVTPILMDRQPTAWGRSPFCFGRFIGLRITGIGPHAITARVTDRSSDVFVGLSLPLKVSLAHLGEFEVEARIDAAYRTGDDVGLHLRICAPSYDYRRAVGEYLALAADRPVSLASLREAGHVVRGLDSAIEMECVSTSDTAGMQEILELRHRVAIDDGRIDESTKPADLLDRYDRYSRQLVFRLHGRVVAATRITFLDGDTSRSEISEHADVPKFLLKGNTAETGRTAVDPDYRGGDIYVNLLRHTTRVAIEEGLQYLVADCRPFLLPVYRRIGAIDTKRTIDHPFYPDEPMHLIYWDVAKASVSVPGTLPHAAHVTMPIYEYMLAAGTLARRPWLSAQLRVGRLVNRVTQAIRHRRGARR